MARSVEIVVSQEAVEAYVRQGLARDGIVVSTDAKIHVRRNHKASTIKMVVTMEVRDGG